MLQTVTLYLKGDCPAAPGAQRPVPQPRPGENLEQNSPPDPAALHCGCDVGEPEHPTAWLPAKIVAGNDLGTSFSRSITERRRAIPPTLPNPHHKSHKREKGPRQTAGRGHQKDQWRRRHLKMLPLSDD